MSLRGVFVTGTDTGVGKTIVAAAIAAALRARGENVAAVKPVVTGLDEPEPGHPPDHELLAAAAGGGPPAAVTTLTFGPPLSPHLAAQLDGVVIEPSELVAHAHAAGQAADVLVAEGRRRPARPAHPRLPDPRLCARPRPAAGGRRPSGPGDHQSHAADARIGPRGRAQRRGGRADSVARRTDHGPDLQPRDDRRARTGRGLRAPRDRPAGRRARPAGAALPLDRWLDQPAAG